VKRKPPARREGGFTLVELAVVFIIVALLFGTLLYTLSAQLDQRNFAETRRRLETARELLISYAIVNGRLPCPAIGGAGAMGDEAPVGGGNCTTNYAGWLPARTIGYQEVDTSGYALDSYGNRIRYAVANGITGCAGASTTPHFTNSANLKTNGITCQPNDLLVCKSVSGINATNCGSAANQVTNLNVVVAIVFSVGKNGALGAAGTDEAANVNGDPVFVFHTPAPQGAANGEFDDYLVWIPVGEFYGRLISAGVLP
jgi:type II secretory pathway pseudopilin PulG